MCVVTCQKIIDEVAEFRRLFNPWWPTPDLEGPLMYAYSEMGEVLDAWLREQRPDDKRNGQRDSDVLFELADVAIMLATALSEHREPPPLAYLSLNAELSNLGIKVAAALWMATQPMESPDSWAVLAWEAL